MKGFFFEQPVLVLNFKNSTLVFLLLFHVVEASNDQLGLGARAVALGNATSALTDQWSVFNNIAGIAALEQMHISGSFDQRYTFQGFNTIALVANQPTKFGNGALGLVRFGDQLYNETRVNVGWAHKIHFVSLGLQFEYAQVAIQELATRRNLLINFGGQADITKELRFGAHIYNLNQAKFVEYQNERIPTVMKLGLSYRPIKQLMLNGEVEKDIDKKVRYKFAIEYSIIEKIHIRTGVNIQPQSLFCGIGYHTQVVFVDYALSWHQQLGISHALSLSFRFFNRKKNDQTGEK